MTEEKKEIRDPKTGRLYKGVVLNPNGRPKGIKSMNTVMREALLEYEKYKDADGKEKEAPMNVLLIRKLMGVAMKGDLQAIKLLLQYDIGMPTQRIDYTKVEKEVSPERKAEIDNLLNKI